MANTLGALIIDLESKTLSQEEQELLAHPLVGGVILFTRNYDSRAQLQTLCQHIRACRKQPLLIMVDQEGGRVQRFIPEFTRLPAMRTFGQMYDDQPHEACTQARQTGWLMAAELLSVGIDLSFAPVLDVDKGLSSVIGDRAFHTAPQAIIRLAGAFIQGMAEAGMAATGKHFPGHGSVSLDSHVAVPVDPRTLNEIEQGDLIPFAALIASGLKAIMAAHIIFPAVDERPVSFSRQWLQVILREQLRFSGVIFSDDLNMEGANISANYADRVAAAREAGCDFVLLCNQRKGVIQVLNELSAALCQVNEPKWRGVLARHFSYAQESIKENQRWQDARRFLLSLAQKTVKV